MAVLCHGVRVEPGRGRFDPVVRLSTLRPGEPITVPTRKNRVLNTRLAKPGARLIQGCTLSKKGFVWVEVPEPKARQSGDVIGVDVGINKLIAPGEEQAIGKDWRQISVRVRRRHAASTGKRRALLACDHFIKHAAKQWPWDRLSAVGSKT